jgi:hypothetical protein
MHLNPYQSPTIAGQPPAERQLSFRRRYWFEILIVADILLVLFVAIAHRSLRGVLEWYLYRPVILLLIGCWLSGPVLALCACGRALLLLNKKTAWRGIFAASFAILVLLANLTATWIHPPMEAISSRFIVELVADYWPRGIPFP